MTVITSKAQFIANYKAAEARAVRCPQGLAIAEQDRIALTAQRKALGLDYGMAASLLSMDTSTQSKHYNRFMQWDQQIKRGQIRVAPEATGQHIGAGAGKSVVVLGTFDGRIKTRDDIQPAFNKAAVQLVKLGITNPHEAAAYLANGFQYAKEEQKIETKADRLLGELRMGDLTKPQALAVLDRIKAQL